MFVTASNPPADLYPCQACQITDLYPCQACQITDLYPCQACQITDLYPCQARQINAAYEERHDAKCLSELKQFVSKLPHMQAERKSLELQTGIASLVCCSRFQGVYFSIKSLSLSLSLSQDLLTVPHINRILQNVVKSNYLLVVKQ